MWLLQTHANVQDSWSDLYVPLCGSNDHTLFSVKCKFLIILNDCATFVWDNIANWIGFQVESNGMDKNIYRSRSQLDAYEDFSTMRASDLKIRIDEMLHIKVEIYIFHSMLILCV